MTSFEFQRWLLEMRIEKRASSDRACARILGLSANTLINWKKNGTPGRVADMACKAALHGLKPYGGLPPADYP